MAIREHIFYDGNQYYGHVDVGLDQNDSDKPRKAKSALVLMVVALNGHWKVPVGYFLIDSMTGKERANLVENCLELIHETGVILHSLTFDGTNVNLSMCNNLGANFQLGENFKPYFIHPITQEKVYCFLDQYHMLKLVRNTLGDKLELRYKGKSILWENIISLQKL